MNSKLIFGFMYENEFFKNGDFVEVKGHLQGYPNKKCHTQGYLFISNPESSWIGIKENLGCSFKQIVPVQIDSISILKHIKEANK